MSTDRRDKCRNLLTSDGKYCMTYWGWREGVDHSRDCAGEYRFATAEDREMYMNYMGIYRGSYVAIGFGYVVYSVQTWEEETNAYLAHLHKQEYDE